MMRAKTEARSRVTIDALPQDAGWNLTDGSSVLYEQTLPEGMRSTMSWATARADRWRLPKRFSPDPASGFGHGQGPAKP